MKVNKVSPIVVLLLLLLGGSSSFSQELLLLLGGSSSFSQEYEDVIYLKDGGIRRGMIIERIPYDSIKLKTVHGDIFVINVADVDRIAKEYKIKRAVRPAIVNDVALFGQGFFERGYLHTLIARDHDRFKPASESHSDVDRPPIDKILVGPSYNAEDLRIQLGLIIKPTTQGSRVFAIENEFRGGDITTVLGFIGPWKSETPIGISLKLHVSNTQYYEFYDYRRSMIVLRISRPFWNLDHSSLSFGYRLESEEYENFGERFDPSLLYNPSYSSRYDSRTTSSFELVYSRDTRDQAQFPTKGTLFTYTPEIASPIVAGDVDFHKHEVGFNYYRPSWWKFVWSLETKVAVIDGFTAEDDRNLSIWNRFSPGGVDYWDGQVRGYPDRSLGPRISNFNIGGRSMIVANVEWRFPIVEHSIHGIVFADAGNAWESIPDMSPLKLRRSVGFGLRVEAPIPLMIAQAYGFDRKKVDGIPGGWHFHLQFGSTFY